MRVRNWDTETADTCELPNLIPDICERCRDYAYCHRQMTIFDAEDVSHDQA
jgi:hypothetical protein